MNATFVSVDAPCRLGLILLLLLAAVGDGGAAAPPDTPPSEAVPMEVRGVHNAFRLGPQLYSGSSPEGDRAFADLARLGVKTIISVDGARPDVEAAHRHGLRYVHLPHGYDGIGTNVQVRLIQASRTLPGAIFVHCHHGKHRGPAAAALIGLASQGWTPDRADAFLRQAGTSTNYPGLYQAIHRFQAPAPGQVGALPADLPEVADVPGLVEVMVAVDARWENLLAVRRAGYRAPPEHPDLDPAAEAVVLWEHFREARRFPESRQGGPALIQSLESAEEEGRAVERLLRQCVGSSSSDLRAQLDRAFEAVKESCSRCHRRHRDRPTGTAPP